MKKIFLIGALALLASGVTFAQEKKTKAGKAVESVGNETAEVAVKGASKVSDKTYKDKVGPQGQTVYINKHSQYYYVNEKGGKVYLKKSQLKDKPKN
ncbi:hypothetical protein GS399_07830 [Pedobacter sp. HMF7647]|uniref:PBCV-specific basic adaptor domain-containing protein n=1 Tax=Hufsiella arboris TaxID=2695275 RepID=A0A7K1Y931_9SPHI|nr:hypothetical protein [Hufsiella arboris]MXV50881.1 hypothetical protein [Hufsiella arboris]